MPEEVSAKRPSSIKGPRRALKGMLEATGLKTHLRRSLLELGQTQELMKAAGELATARRALGTSEEKERGEKKQADEKEKALIEACGEPYDLFVARLKETEQAAEEKGLDLELVAPALKRMLVEEGFSKAELDALFQVRFKGCEKW